MPCRPGDRPRPASALALSAFLPVCRQPVSMLGRMSSNATCSTKASAIRSGGLVKAMYRSVHGLKPASSKPGDRVSANSFPLTQIEHQGMSARFLMPSDSASSASAVTCLSTTITLWDKAFGKSRFTAT